MEEFSNWKKRKDQEKLKTNKEGSLERNRGMTIVQFRPLLYIWYTHMVSYITEKIRPYIFPSLVFYVIL